MNRRERRLAAKRSRKAGQRGSPSASRPNPMLAQATALHQAGRIQEAEQAYREILARSAEDPDALHQLGLLVAATRSPDEGAAMMERALALRPAFAEAAFNLGTIRHQQGRFADAVVRYQEALETRPDFTEALFNLATVHLDQARYRDAQAAFERVLAVDATHAKALNGLGIALQEQGRTADARAAFERALDADAKELDAYVNLGNLHYDQGEPEAARQAYAGARAVRPSDALRIKEATVLPAIMGSRDDVTASRSAFDSNVRKLLDGQLRVEDPYVEIGMTGFYLAYHGVNDRPSQEGLAELLLKAAPSLQYEAPHAAGPVTGTTKGRLRIGIVSRHFANHTIGRLMRGVVAGLDRDAFEVIVLTWPHAPDPLASEITQRADHAIYLPDSLEGARSLIADARLDILYYADIGMEPLTYFLAFARLAPVQCVFWGHPMTTGLRSVDYFVSARDLEIDGAEDHYTEALLLPEVPTVSYRRPDRPPEAANKSAFGLDETRHCYLCPQTLFKFHPDFDPLIGNILDRDTNGEFVLIEGKHPEWQERLTERWQNSIGTAAERIRFLPRQGYQDFMRLLSAADVILDPTVFGGGNTTLEALAMGTPVVTLPGNYLRDRISYAWYRKMELDDCVASNADNYVTIAVELASNDEMRRETVGRIEARSPVLFDDDRAVRGLEAVLLEAVDTKR